MLFLFCINTAVSCVQCKDGYAIFAIFFRSSHWRCCKEKGVLKNFSKFVVKKETLALVFSHEFCETLKNTFFAEHFRTTASQRNISKENFKITLHLKVMFCHVICRCNLMYTRQRHIQDAEKHLQWSFLLNYLTAYSH